MHRQRIAYVIADSCHGRIVMWDNRTHDYRTRLTIDSGPGLRARAPSEGDVRKLPPKDRSQMGDRIALRKRLRSEFAGVLIERIRAFTRAMPIEGIVLAAPARFLALLREGLPDHPPVVGTVAKDLVKFPDHELSGWLGQVGLHGPAAGTTQALRG